MTKTAVEALSDEERAEIRDTFKLLDRDGDGYLTVRELGDAMRAMAQHPTEREIQFLVRKPDQQTEEQKTEADQKPEDGQNTEGEQSPEVVQKPEVEETNDKTHKANKKANDEPQKTNKKDNALTDLEAFTVIMAKRLTVPEKDDQLLEAFKIFDAEGTGVISASDLRKIVTTMGERLTDEEVEEMIRDADDDGDGQINYQDFTNLMLS